MAEFNVQMGRVADAGEDDGPRKGLGPIDLLEGERNVPWQTRAAPLSEYEDRLADALEAILGDGIHDLAGIVGRLNEAGVGGPDGEIWTEDSFVAEMERLGA